MTIAVNTEALLLMGEDHRWRVVYQRYSLQLSVQKIATNWNIDH